MSSLVIFQVARLTVKSQVTVRSTLSNSVLLLTNETLPDQRQLHDLYLSECLSHLHGKLIINVFHGPYLSASPCSLYNLCCGDLTVDLSHESLLFYGKLVPLIIALSQTVQLFLPMTESAIGPLN